MQRLLTQYSKGVPGTRRYDQIDLGKVKIGNPKSQGKAAGVYCDVDYDGEKLVLLLEPHSSFGFSYKAPYQETLNEDNSNAVGIQICVPEGETLPLTDHEEGTQRFFLDLRLKIAEKITDYFLFISGINPEKPRASPRPPAGVENSIPSGQFNTLKLTWLESEYNRETMIGIVADKYVKTIYSLKNDKDTKKPDTSKPRQAYFNVETTLERGPDKKPLGINPPTVTASITLYREEKGKPVVITKAILPSDIDGTYRKDQQSTGSARGVILPSLWIKSVWIGNHQTNEAIASIQVSIVSCIYIKGGGSFGKPVVAMGLDDDDEEEQAEAPARFTKEQLDSATDFKDETETPEPAPEPEAPKAAPKAPAKKLTLKKSVSNETEAPPKTAPKPVAKKLNLRKN